MLSLTRLSVLTLIGGGLISCTTYKGTNEDGTATGATNAFDVNKYPIHKTVCDPFGGDPVGNLQEGVKAELFYKGSSQPTWNKVGDYLAQGHSSQQSLFFSEINVPTRLFSLGFPTETGGVVADDSGQALFEYFALKFSGRLRLGAEDEPGTYELALLSDDGAILSFSSEGESQVMVSNDGDHPTRLGCGQTVEMTNESLIPFELQYYQGPRYHISVIPLWRKVTAATQPESLCGTTGNNTYFDYNNNSEPQQAYKDLLARGWKPWSKDNYTLPSDEDHNPCFPGEVPIISEIVVDHDLDLGLTISWNTNIPATTQVLMTYVTGGTEELTVSDNILRTSHQVRISNYLPSGEYEFRAVSISDTYGKAISHPIPFTAR